MKLSTQIASFMRDVRSGFERARAGKAPFVIDCEQLCGVFTRWSHEAQALELDIQQSNGLSDEWLTSLVTKCRWVISNERAGAVTRELAEAVLILVNSRTPV